MKRLVFFVVVFFLFAACSKEVSKEKPFQLLDANYTGITFENNLSYTEQFNPYTYRNFYNGAGVAVGDFNNDGLPDLFFAGNQVDNKLYLNKGDFKFEDITEQSGLSVAGVWCTGVSVADVNGDGWLDIFICKSGPLSGENRHNQLFINNGDLTFTDRSKEYGLDEISLSQHAVFFDYDLDGDLDLYLLSNSMRSIGINDLRLGERDIRDPLGNKLYRNDGNRFTDVSEEAGIYGSAIGYGLGVTVADLNKDGWPDIYVSNDFFEKDYCYINNGNGSFTEMLEDMMSEISMGSMGADIADLDNDGFAEIFVTEMLPDSLQRVKTKTPFESWDRYQSNLASCFFHQFTRNTLQWNNGFTPDQQQVYFKEVSRMAGVHATDWSWGALIFDVNNDGWKDIFVANGIAKDLTDHDFVNYYANNAALANKFKKDSSLLTNLIDVFPSVPLANHLYINQQNLGFSNENTSFGLDQLSFSNGAVYVDLDNDGDLDLVVSNINGPAFVYKNMEVERNRSSWLQLSFGNDFGVKVELYAGGQYQYAEYFPVKGYMSSMDHRIHFGLGNAQSIDSLFITWPGEETRIFENILIKQWIKPHRSEGKVRAPKLSKSTPMYALSASQIDWAHKESNFIDFDRDRLLFQMISNEGPGAAVADLNGDGYEDIVIGGAKDQLPSVFFGSAAGTFTQGIFPQDTDLIQGETVAISIFDANGDGFPDVFLAQGSHELSTGHSSYRDRLFLNDGKGNFTEKSNAFQPAAKLESSAFILPIDMDGDGDMDLIIGQRCIPFAYGVPGSVYLWENDGKGNFKEVSKEKAPEWNKIGMLKAAIRLDVDNDGVDEILLAGEWMGLKLYQWKEGKYKDISAEYGLNNTNGFWHTLAVGDFNNDGYVDFVAGNMGTNTRYAASHEFPLTMHVNDFDRNGSVEQIICQFEGQNSYPLAMLHDLGKQLPGLKKQNLKFHEYKKKTLAELFPKEILETSIEWKVETLSSQLFINQRGKEFSRVELPVEAQTSQIFALEATDINKDGNLDLIVGGNQSKIKPEWGSNMASYGLVMLGDGNGGFQPLKAAESGIYVQGEIREILSLKNDRIIFIRNNQSPLIYQKK